MTLFTSDAEGVIRRPRPPRLIWPPLRPAARASSAVHSCAVPYSCAARPPLLAISRCFSGDIDANPRRSFRIPSTVLLLAAVTTLPKPRNAARAFRSDGGRDVVNSPSRICTHEARSRLQAVCHMGRGATTFK